MSGKVVVKLGVVAVATVLAAGLCVAGSGVAGATPLPFNGFGGIAVDDAHNQVFTSGTGSTVAVTRFDGSTEATIDLGAKTGGLALVGSTLYAVVTGDDAIVPIDTATLTPGTAIPLPDPVAGPSPIVVVSGLLWVGWGDCQTDGGLASVDPTGGDITVFATSSNLWIDSFCPRLASSSSLSNRLFVWDPFGRPAPVSVIETVGSPSVVGKINDVYDGPTDVAVTSDGSKVIVGWSDAGQGLHEYNAADLSPTGRVYDMGAGGSLSNVEVSATGQIIAVDEEIKGFEQGTSKPTYVEPGGSWQQAIALADDGLLGFGVGGGDGVSELFRFFPRQVATRLQVRLSTKRVTFGQRVRLSGHLSLGPDATNRSVMIYRRFPDRGPTVVAKRVVDGSGSFSVALVPSHNAEYWAEYEGDIRDQDATSPRRSLSVEARVTGRLDRYYATSGGVRLYHFTSCREHQRGCPTLMMTVGPNRAGEPVNYGVQARIDGIWRYIYGGNKRLSPRSRAKVGLVFGSRESIGVLFRMRADFTPDDLNLGGVSEWEDFRLTA